MPEIQKRSSNFSVFLVDILIPVGINSNLNYKNAMDAGNAQTTYE